MQLSPSLHPQSSLSVRKSRLQSTCILGLELLLLPAAVTGLLAFDLTTSEFRFVSECLLMIINSEVSECLSTVNVRLTGVEDEERGREREKERMKGR